MVNIRNANDIILSLIDFFKLAQPDLDTKPGTVARDLFIDAPSTQLSLLYDQLSNISNKQSLRLVAGIDLDKLGKNFGVQRKQASPSSGIGLFTFASLDAPVSIPKGGIAFSINGFSFSVNAGISVNSNSSNFYRSVASKFRNELDTVGITDQYAVEVTLVATTAGNAGNIGKFSLNRTNISGVSNVTNILSFSGGTNSENDAAYRDRILSVFSGSSVGTALGYLNVALSNTGVSDAYVVQPGDPLMTRDGSIVQSNTDGTRTILSEGSGGKVDIVILGTSLSDNSDTFIYLDKSNNNDPTDSRNDFVLGQITADAGKTITRKRVDDIKNGVLPAQPANTITEVTGSVSGSNFIAKTTDIYGRVTGNYEIISDTGTYAGSPWGLDRFHWINNKISGFQEDRIKGQYNGQDATSFTDVVQIPNVQQSISVTNENSIVSTDRSIIQLLHFPCTSVTRVFNVNTGERYLITSQNFDGTGTVNNTGRIQISGNTLPSPSDILQVDYNWIISYDQYTDYDGRLNTSNPRSVTDSVDWGFSSVIKNERILFLRNVSNTFFVGASSHPANTVLTAKTFKEVDSAVYRITSGVFVNRLAANVINLVNKTVSIDSAIVRNTTREVYATAQDDGTFISNATVVGIDIFYNTTIILPTDTSALENDRLDIILDGYDVFTVSNNSGSTNNTQITIPVNNFSTLSNNFYLLTTYIANTPDLFSSNITSVPTSRLANGYLLNNNIGFNNFSPVNISKYENLIIQKNLSNQFYVELSISAAEYLLNPSNVLSVVKLLNGLEVWNPQNLGTVATGTSGNLQLILSGYNVPAVGDKVLAYYYPTDIKRFQPFSFTNSVIKYRNDTLGVDNATGGFSLALNLFYNETAMTFDLIDVNTNLILQSINDGYLTVNPSNPAQAFIASYSFNFATLPTLLQYRVKINTGTYISNLGIYDIFNYDIVSNTLLISDYFDKINNNQVSVIRLTDGKELWNSSCTISPATNVNTVVIPLSSAATFGDRVLVVFFNYNNLRRTPTRIAINSTDQVVNPGALTVSGTTLVKATDIIFNITNDGLKQNLLEATRKALNLNSTTAIPSNIKLARITKLEKVNTVSASGNIVLSVSATYDLKETSIQDNKFYLDNLLSDNTLNNLEFILPNTANNSSTANGPKIGDKFRITFYYTVDNDLETLSYTRNGVLYTNKLFALINKVYVSSGFTTSKSTKITLSSFNQPGLGARYKAIYDYIAPKQNERIVIKYNYNKIISDVTFNVEQTRPINADVIVRQDKEVKLDLSISVVIDSTKKNQTTTIIQNVRDKLISTLTTTKLGQSVATSTIINQTQSVSGITRAQVIYFNKNGYLGQVTSVQSQNDEHFTSNNIVINYTYNT